MNPFIITYPGKRRLNPLALTDTDIDIGDIAHSLSQINRFVGHSPYPISVAQHAVIVSQLCENHPTQACLVCAWQGLHHDDSEYVLGDVSKWLKMSPEMKAYRDAEDYNQRAIYDHFGCPREMTKLVTAMDKLMVRYEAAICFGRDTVLREPDYPAITPEEEWMVDKYFYRCESYEAEGMFLATYNRLLKLRVGAT